MRKTQHGKYLGHVFDMRVDALAANPSMSSRCWLWPGSTDGGGYFHVKIRAPDGRCTSVVGHKRAYERLVGPVPKGMQLDHLCNTPHCYNPSHLKPSTARENVLRSTGPAAKNAAKTHCRRGHPLVGGNLRSDKRQWRLCRQCTRERDRERKREQRRQRGLKHAAGFIPPLKPMAA